MKNIIAFLLSPLGLDQRDVPIPEMPPFPLSPDEHDPFKTPPVSNDFVAPGCEQFGEHDALESALDRYPPIEPVDDYAGTVGNTVMTLREKKDARYPKRQVQEGPFIWETDKGVAIKPKNMATPHLFYTLRMIFNHSMPPLARVGDFNRRRDVANWPLNYRLQAGHAMTAELAVRKDVEPWMRFEMADMEENAEFVTEALHAVVNEPQVQLAVSQADLDSAEKRAATSVLDLPSVGNGLPRKPTRKPTRKAKVQVPPYMRTAKVNGYFQDRGGKQVWINGYRR